MIVIVLKLVLKLTQASWRCVLSHLSWSLVPRPSFAMIVSCVQAVYYFTHQTDQWRTKLLVRARSSKHEPLGTPLIQSRQVAAVMVFDTVHQALITHSSEYRVALLSWLLYQCGSASLHLHGHTLRCPRKIGSPCLVRTISV